jgi:hypothetical protein
MSRVQLELATATVFFILAVVTAVWPQWIELLFGVRPDEGSGALEWAIVAVFGAAAVVTSVLARRDFKRLQTAKGE